MHLECTPHRLARGQAAAYRGAAGWEVVGLHKAREGPTEQLCCLCSRRVAAACCAPAAGEEVRVLHGAAICHIPMPLPPTRSPDPEACGSQPAQRPARNGARPAEQSRRESVRTDQALREGYWALRSGGWRPGIRGRRLEAGDRRPRSEAEVGGRDRVHSALSRGAPFWALSPRARSPRARSPRLGLGLGPKPCAMLRLRAPQAAMPRPRGAAMLHRQAASRAAPCPLFCRSHSGRREGAGRREASRPSGSGGSSSPSRTGAPERCCGAKQKG